MALIVDGLLSRSVLYLLSTVLVNIERIIKFTTEFLFDIFYFKSVVK